MSQKAPHSDALNAVLSRPLDVGEPDLAGSLAVYPIFGPEPTLDYASFYRAHGAGTVSITELQGGASVNDLSVQNQGSAPVLLYEGEELIGAQQNRVLDISLLIAAQAKTVIPVSCVEAGRWDGRRHGERFRPSRQTADPEMRKLKHRRVRERVAAGAAPRADQGETWDAVEDRMQAMSVASPTASMHDVYEGRRESLGALREPIRLHEGQCGAVCAIAGQISILDYVGRPDVWADLHPALVEGYALDALGSTIALDGDAVAPPEAPELATVRGFTLLVTDAPAQGRGHEAGIGETVRFASGGVAGSALLAGEGGGGELVQLTAYPDQRGADAGPSGPRHTRVRRPSARR